MTATINRCSAVNLAFVTIKENTFIGKGESITPICLLWLAFNFKEWRANDNNRKQQIQLGRTDREHHKQ